MLDPISAAAVANLLKASASTVTVLRAVAPVVPPGRDRRRRRRDERHAAYRRFEAASIDFAAWLGYMPALAEAAPSPLAQFVHIRVITEGTGEARTALAEYLAALAQVRLEGNPEPRAAAEEITALLAELAERTPHTRWPRSRRRQEDEKFLEVQRALGYAHKQFTLVARRDLGYARPLRRHWWQWRRPKTEEEWPGGWPGPAVQGLLDAAALSQREQQPSSDSTATPGGAVQGPRRRILPGRRAGIRREPGTAVS